MADYRKIKAEYIAGGSSIRKLADKYGVSFSSLTKISANEKWTELRKKTGKKYEEKICESVSTKKAKKVDRINDVADMLLQEIENGIKNGEFEMSTKAIKELASAVKDIKDIKGYKSDRDVREQEARIAKLQREAVTEEKNNDIKVVISADLEEFAG